MHISVSLLSSYIYCKRKLFLTEVLGLVEPDKAEMAKGSIRHDTYDKINKIDESIVKGIREGDSFDEIEQKYMLTYSRLLRETIMENLERLRALSISPTAVYKETWNYFISEARARALNVDCFIKKHNLFGEELWQKLTPKIMSEFSVSSDKLMLKGRIDRIEDYGDFVVPVELKTGKMPSEGVWPGHRIQIAAYILLLQEASSKQIKEGFVHYLDADEKRLITLNPFLRDEVIEIANKVNDLLKSREIPEIENQNKCEKCSLKYQCSDEKLLNKALKQLLKQK